MDSWFNSLTVAPPAFHEDLLASNSTDQPSASLNNPFFDMCVNSDPFLHMEHRAALRNPGRPPMPTFKSSMRPSQHTLTGQLLVQTLPPPLFHKSPAGSTSGGNSMSPKTREKSKNAARSRRSKESSEYADLSRVLPIQANVASTLDKASIARLTLSYLYLRRMFPLGVGDALGRKHEHFTNDQYQHSIGRGILKTLEGFIFIIIPSGRFIYVSETVTNVLGLSHPDIIGADIRDFIDPTDQDDLTSTFELEPHERPPLSASEQDFAFDRKFVLRIRCNLAKRAAGLMYNKYKVMHCYGKLKFRRVFSKDGAQLKALGMIVYCHVIPMAGVGNTEVRLENDMFMSRSGLDFQFFFLEGRVLALTGYNAQELVDKSIYQFIHRDDIDNLRLSHETLLRKQQETPMMYRLLVKGGGWIWVQSYAVLVQNNRSSRPSCIVCINYVVTGIQHAEVKLHFHAENHPKSTSVTSSGKLSWPESVSPQDSVGAIPVYHQQLPSCCSTNACSPSDGLNQAIQLETDVYNQSFLHLQHKIGYGDCIPRMSTSPAEMVSDASSSPSPKGLFIFSENEAKMIVPSFDGGYGQPATVEPNGSGNGDSHFVWNSEPNFLCPSATQNADYVDCLEYQKCTQAREYAQTYLKGTSVRMAADGQGDIWALFHEPISGNETMLTTLNEETSQCVTFMKGQDNQPVSYQLGSQSSSRYSQDQWNCSSTIRTFGSMATHGQPTHLFEAVLPISATQAGLPVEGAHVGAESVGCESIQAIGGRVAVSYHHSVPTHANLDTQGLHDYSHTNLHGSTAVLAKQMQQHVPSQNTFAAPPEQIFTFDEQDETSSEYFNSPLTQDILSYGHRNSEHEIRSFKTLGKHKHGAYKNTPTDTKQPQMCPLDEVQHEPILGTNGCQSDYISLTCSSAQTPETQSFSSGDVTTDMTLNSKRLSPAWQSITHDIPYYQTEYAQTKTADFRSHSPLREAPNQHICYSTPVSPEIPRKIPKQASTHENEIVPKASMITPTKDFVVDHYYNIQAQLESTSIKQASRKLVTPLATELMDKTTLSENTTSKSTPCVYSSLDDLEQATAAQQYGTDETYEPDHRDIGFTDQMSHFAQEDLLLQYNTLLSQTQGRVRNGDDPLRLGEQCSPPYEKVAHDGTTVAWCQGNYQQKRFYYPYKQNVCETHEPTSCYADDRY